MKICEIALEDADTIISLYMQYLDGGDYIEEELRSQMQRPDFVGFKALDDNNRIVGFVMGCSLIEFTIPHPEYEKEIYDVIGQNKYWVLQAFLVLPHNRNAGLGMELILELKKKLRSEGFKYVFIEVWIKPDGTCPSKHCYDMLGKMIWSRVDFHFYVEGYKYGIVCSLCGTHCKCGALLELIELDDSFTRKDRQVY